MAVAVGWALDEHQEQLEQVDTSSWLRPIEVWSRYQWGPGDCFKCERDDGLVAKVGESVWESGPPSDLTFCQPCTYRLYLKHVREACGLPPLRVTRVLHYDTTV